MSSPVIIIMVLVSLIMVIGGGVGLYFYLQPVECKYESEEFGEWEDCDDKGNTNRRRKADGEEFSHCKYVESKPCSEVIEECEYTPYKFGEPDMEGIAKGKRTLVSGPKNICKDFETTKKINCIYKNPQFSDWSQCDSDGITTRVRPAEGKEYAHCSYKEMKNCKEVKEGCHYSDWVLGTPDSKGNATARRTLISGSQNLCKDLTKTEFIECKYKTPDFGDWGECDTQGKTRRIRNPDGPSLSHCQYSIVEDCDKIKEECAYTEWENQVPDDSGKAMSIRTRVSGPENVCKDVTRKLNVLELDVSAIRSNQLRNSSIFSVEYTRHSNGSVLLAHRVKFDKGLGKYYVYNVIDVPLRSIRFYIHGHTGPSGVSFNTVKYNGIDITNHTTIAQYARLYTKYNQVFGDRIPLLE